MGDFDCLLIGKELINKIRASTVDWGYINGFTHDDVLGAFSADIGEKNLTVSQASLLISQHRFFDNNYKKGILLWVKISNDLLKQIKNISISVEELKEKMPCGLFKKLDEKGLNYILLLGETDKDYRFCIVFKRKDEEKFTFVPGDIELLDEEPNPFKRIDGLVPIEELKEKEWVLSKNVFGECLVMPKELRDKAIPAIAKALINWRITSNQARTFSLMETLAIAISSNANSLAGAIRAKLIEDGEKLKAKPIIDETAGADVFVTLPCSGYVLTVNESSDALDKAEQKLIEIMNTFDYESQMQ